MKTTYLAVMPRHRRPKAVPKGDIGYYQRNARMFFEAPGMTAAEARDAIADGTLQPTWINGRPVVGYASDTGRPRVESRVSLTEMIDEVEAKKAYNAVLRIGRTVYIPQWAYYPATHYGPRRVFTWHEVQLSGFTYSEQPMTGGDLHKHLRNHDDFEMGYLQEDYNGVSMGGIVVLVRSGKGLAMINNEDMRRELMDLMGRKYRVVKVIGGGALREADLVW